MSSDSPRMCVKVVVDGDEKTVRPLWPFQDHIFTYEWVNDWAGMEVAKPPASAPKRPKVSARMRRLLGDRE